MSSFRLAPAVHARVNRMRLRVDIMGVTLVRFLLPMIQLHSLVLALCIYNIVAWVTIFTVDSTRIPEFTTTRKKQRQAWKFTAICAPGLAAALVLTAVAFHIRLRTAGFTHGWVFSVTLSSYMDELLFRNTLQPALRKMGLAKWTAVALQSLLFASAMFIQTRVPGIAVMALFLGVINGWVVYRFRTLWPVFALDTAWRILFQI